MLLPLKQMNMEPEFPRAEFLVFNHPLLTELVHVIGSFVLGLGAEQLLSILELVTEEN